jgi:NADH:ubiquinone oxidoreductase subunit H
VLFLWVRASYPRFRYDQLMYLTWKKYLPLSLSLLILFRFLLSLKKGLPVGLLN